MQVTLQIIILLLLLGCNHSKTEKIPSSTNTSFIPSDLEIEKGGYSWWSGPYLVPTDELIESYYVTGVNDHKDISSQWVAKFVLNDEGNFAITERKVLFEEFRGDEHNAPAILSQNDNIIIALTGHAEHKESLQNQVYIYRGNSLDSLTKTVIETSGPPSYVQLLSIDGDLLLFSRIGYEAFSYIYSSDNGITWSNWRPVIPRSLYAKVEYNKITSKLHFYIGVHPSIEQQYIKTISTTYNGHEITPIKDNAQLDNGLIKGSKLDLIKDFPIGKSARILSHFTGEYNLLLYAEYAKPTSTSPDESWQLHLAIQNPIDSQWETTLLKDSIQGVLGKRDSASNVGFYVYGGDIDYIGNSLVNIYYAESINGTYQISEVTFDLQLKEIIEKQAIVKSDKELYRPLTFNSKFNRRLLMYNEANFWINYFDWDANQIIKSLD